MNKFTSDLKKLGFSCYDDYLSYSHWANFRAKCERELRMECLCGVKTGLNLHHRTYKNLGHEEIEDVIWLCKKCHYKLHELLKKTTGKLANGVSLLKGSEWFKSRRSAFSKTDKKQPLLKATGMNLKEFSTHELELILTNLPRDSKYEVIQVIRAKILRKLSTN